MTRRRTFLLLLALAGLAAGGYRPADTQTQYPNQCYFRVGIDPPTSCTRCELTCIGSRCCRIVVEPDVG